MERMHLKDGNSIGLTTVDAEGETETRLNLLVTGSASASVSLTPEEEEDLVYMIETGTVRVRCSKCGCVQERACVRVEGETVAEVCGWAELGPVPLCTACVDGASGSWKHPAEQEADFERSFAMVGDAEPEPA